MSGRYVSFVLESDLPPDLKFTAAVFASFADEDGYRIWPAIDHVAHLRGISGRQVQRCVKELCRMNILEVVRPATQWHPTQYRLVREHLPPRAPFKPPDRQPPLPGGESPGEDDSGVTSTSPPPGVTSSAPGVTPMSPDPSLDPSVHTRTTRARETGDGAGVKPASPLNATVGGESPAASLPLIVAPRRDPDHGACAWCGRICVPKFLHKQFKKALGGAVTRRAQRMREFYAETLDAIPALRPIGEEPVKFWRAAFAARFSGGARDRRMTERRADGVRRGGGCPHDPICEHTKDCIQLTLAEARAERQQRQG